ncbi:MAG: hypothetical protein QM692_24380 [Thermomicrobiales bacterium]
MPRPARLAALVLVVAALLAALGGLATRWQGPDDSPASLTSPGAITATPGAFAGAFREHLARVQAAGETLVEIGARRDRNLLTVAQGQSAMTSALAETDAWLAGQAFAPDDPAVAAYRAGATQIRAAMADAQSAFLRFDWDGVAAATQELDSGVAQIRAAQALLAGNPAS